MGEVLSKVPMKSMKTYFRVNTVRHVFFSFFWKPKIDGWTWFFDLVEWAIILSQILARQNVRESGLCSSDRSSRNGEMSVAQVKLKDQNGDFFPFTLILRGIG